MLNATLSSAARSRQTKKEPQKEATSGTPPDVPIPISRRAPQQERRDRRYTDADFEKDLRQLGAKAFFERALWPDGLECPFCGSHDHDIERRENEKPMPYRCRVCREYYSIKSCTVMIHSKLDLETWTRAIYIYTSPRHTTQPLLGTDLADRLGVDEKTAFDIITRLNLAAGSDMFEAPLEETCELDVTELGGNLYRRKGGPHGKKLGRIKVIGVKGRASGQLRLRVIARYTKPVVRFFARRFVGKGQRLHIDAHASNLNIPDVDQHVVNHSKEFVNHADADACTNGIEAEWPILNRALAFVVRSVRFVVHLGGLQGRRNWRQMPHRDRINTLIAGMMGTHRCRVWLPPDELPPDQLPLPFEPIKQVCKHCNDMARRRSNAQAKRGAKQRKRKGKG